VIKNLRKVSNRINFGSLSLGMALSFFLASGSINAETGNVPCVCAVDGGNYNSMDSYGNIRRIDLVNNSVTATSGPIAHGYCPRFAPDGNSFAYLTGTTVVICDPNGTTINQFDVGVIGNISFTNNGIYIGTDGKIMGFDLNGNKFYDKSFSYCGSAYVSQNCAVAVGGADYGGAPSRIVRYDLNSGAFYSFKCGMQRMP